MNISTQHPLTIVFIALMAIAPCAVADILNVPDDFETIQAGIDATEEGDTVLVAPGVYEENINVNQAIVLTSHIVISNDTDFIESTVIDGGERETVVRFTTAEPASIRGFTLINGAGEYGGGVRIDENCSSIIEDMIIRNNTVQQTGGGLNSFRPSDLVMRRVLIEDNHSGGHGGGLNYEGGNILIEDCAFTHNFAGGDGGGFRIAGDTVAILRTLVARNECEGYANAKIPSDAPQLDRLTIVDNVDNGSAGGLVARGTTVTNSIIRGNTGGQVMIVGAPFGLSYCDIEDGEEGVNNHGEVDLVYENNIDEDPLFVDPDNGDYHLTIDSPCIDTGDPEAENDPDGTRADMGAFYFHQRDIEVDQNELLFEAVEMGDEDSLSVIIVNTGNTPLTFNMMRSRDMESDNFILRHESEEITLEALEEFTAWVIFHPLEIGVHETQFRIESDDPDEQFTYVALIGDAIQSVDQSSGDLPTELTLASIYPNPFNSTTIIGFALPEASDITLQIVDLQGRVVETLMTGQLTSGRHTVVWDATDAAAGVYLCRLSANGGSATSKLILTK